MCVRVRTREHGRGDLRIVADVMGELVFGQVDRSGVGVGVGCEPGPSFLRRYPVAHAAKSHQMMQLS